MRSFRLTEKRLAEIEGCRGMGTVKVTFADGSTRGVRIAHDYQLKLFVDTCEWMLSYPPAPPAGMVLDPPPPEPKTPSDRLIHLLGESVALEGEHVTFLQTIAGMARQMVARKKEKEREKASENAATLHLGN